MKTENLASAQEIAAATEIHPRNVQRALKATTFIEVAGRGGRRRLYKIEDLKPEMRVALAKHRAAQTNLAGKAVPAAPTAGSAFSPPPPTDRTPSADATFLSTRAAPQAPGGLDEVGAGAGSTPDARSESLGRVFDAKSDKQKAKGRAALDAVLKYRELLSQGLKAGQAVTAVCAAHRVQPATLNRRLRAVKGEPRDLWLFLLTPGYMGRTKRSDMSAEAWELLKAMYLSKPARTASACIHRLIEANRDGGKGWVLPRARTMQRRLQQLPREMKVLAREGREELLKGFPAQQRVKAALQALDIINGDGYQHKTIWVQFNDGEICRARTWFWQDVHSSKILSWRTDKTEHTDLVRLSFGDLVERYGIPRAVLQDNTRAAANKTMSGGVPHRYRFKVKEEDPDGVYKCAGVERVMWAMPAHGQSKPVERINGIGGISEYVDKAPEFAGRFDDSEKYNGKTRPVPVAQLEAVIAREVAALNARTGRRGAIQRGRSFDEVFRESYERATIRRATEEQRRLWLLCTEPTRVHRNGTIVLDAGRMVGEHRANRYWSRELFEYAGRMVAARFDPAKLHEGVHLYTADGRYIGFGECLEPAGFNDQTAARDHMRDRATFARGAREALQAERRMSARQAGETIAAARNGGGAADSTIPAPRVLRGTFTHPLERPRYQPKERSAEERAEFEHLEAEFTVAPAVNVLDLSDSDKHTYWSGLDKRRRAGDALAEHEESFWVGWQEQFYFKDMTASEAEFDRYLAARDAHAPDA